jgi:flagellar biosynthesis/type III secretory pathway chaperone
MLPELSDVMNEQIRCAEAMLETLGRENVALVAGDADALRATGAHKAQLVESLEALEAQRHDLAGADEAAQRESAEWRKLIEIVSACKDQNQRNGALLKARSEQVQIALRALRGSEPGFYDPSGLKPLARSARPLGTA